MATVTRYLIGLDKWHHMVASGVFTDERLELQDGEIYRLAPIGKRHTALVNDLRKRFEIRCGEQVQAGNE